MNRNHDRCACASGMSSYGSTRPFTLSGTQRVYERARPFAIDHIALDLALVVEDKAVEGTARLDLTRVDRDAENIVLDAVGFEIAAVEIRAAASRRSAKKAAKHAERDGFRPASYVYDGAELRVDVPAGAPTASIRVRYRAVPRRGLYFLAPDEHVPDRPRQVWSQFQDEDARHVFPCHDKPHVKQTTELRVQAPAGWLVLSNGVLADDAKAQKKGLWTWRMAEPHPSYLVTIAAGEFSVLEAEADGVPVTYYVPKGREEDALRTFGRTPDMIRHFGDKTGVKYPWNKYAQIVVSDFIFGGMENTTATTMYEHILLDERAAIDVSSDDLIAHELAHQWFGDLVTCRDWSHAWLNEGFATFMEHVDREHHLGRDEYDYSIKNDFDGYLIEARTRYRRAIVCQDYDAPIDIFDRHLYEKGACVLHMLRRELGDEVFWKGIGRYLERHAKGVVETRDLQRALEDVSGRSLERFFEQWVFRAGHAELSIKVTWDDGVTTVVLKQTQHAAPAHAPPNEASSPVFAFDLAFDVFLPGETKPRREVRRVDQASHTFAFPAKARPRFIVVDPDQAAMADVTLEAPADMLRAQLTGAPTPRGRYLAAAPLGKVDDPATAKALAAALADEKEFWGLRAEVADALGTLRSEEALEALLASVKTPHPKVRRAIAHALGKFKRTKAAEALKRLALKDASYLVEAEAARALGSTRQSTAFDVLVDVLDRPSWADVIRQGALDGLANLRDERALPHVVARTRYGVNTRGRRAAIMALPKLSGDRKTRDVLEELLESADPYLRVDVVRALADLGDPKARGALHRQLERDLDGRVRRRIREALRDLGGAGKREADRLREELESLRNEHAELKSRVGKLESLGKSAERRRAK